MTTSPRVTVFGLFVVLAIAIGSAPAALITYTNSDALNYSSFSGGLGATNWSDGLPPSPGNDYVVAGGRTLRTPTNALPAGPYIFAGNSLILGDGTNGAGTLSMKCTNVVTVNNLILTNGTVLNGDPGVSPKITRIAGTINVLTNGNLRPTDTNRTLVVTATLTGSGTLNVADRGLVQLSGSHPYNGMLAVTGTTLEMDGTVVMTPSGLAVGRDSSVVNNTNFFRNATNIVRAGGSLNVGSGTGGDLRVGWRTTSNTTNVPLGVLDVSVQPHFAANVGNFTIGYSQSGGAGAAGASGLVYLATNNTIIATNILMADTQEGNSPTPSLLMLGSGNNLLDTPIMTVGRRKQTATVTLPAGGTLVLTNSAAERTDLFVGDNAVGTSAVPTNSMNLTGGPVNLRLGTLGIGLKSSGMSGGVHATLTLSTNAGNVVDVNTVTLGSMVGNVSGTTAANGILNANGGAWQVNGDLTLGTWDMVAGAANGTLNLRDGVFNVLGQVYFGAGNSVMNIDGGTLAVAGDIWNMSGGTNTINLNGGRIDLLPAGDALPGNLGVTTLRLNSTITNAGNLTVGTLQGTGAIRNQTGSTTVGARLSPGTDATAGTLSLGNTTMAGGSVLALNLTNTTTVGAGVNDLLSVNGDMDLSLATVTVSPLAGILATGTPYRIAEYTGEIVNGLPAVAGVGRYSLALSANTAASPKQLNLTVTGNPFNLKWGGELGSAWDLSTTANWTNRASNLPDLYYDADNVLFDDATFNTFVQLDTTVQPGSVTFSNQTLWYTLNGSGRISGVSGLTKQGSGALSLNTSNDFSGPVLIAGGLLIAGSDGALGATNGATTINGGTLDVNDKRFQGEIIQVRGAGYDGNGAIINGDMINANGARYATRFVVLDGDTTVGGPGRWDIRGSGPIGSGYLQGTNHTLTKIGPAGVYLCDGIDINVGEIRVGQGSFTIETGSIINTNADLIVSNGAYLSFYRLASPMGRPVRLEDGATLRCTDAAVASQNQVSGPVTLQGAAYFNTTGATPNTLHLAGPITGPGQFVKTGAMVAELLHSDNNWLGGTTISNGTLSVGNGLVNGSLPPLPGVITNYGTLIFNLASNTTVTTAHEITGTGGFRKIGDGILAMTQSNSFTGPVLTGDGVSLSGGPIRLLNRYAFGDPSISKTVQVVRAEVRLEGGMDVASNVHFQISANSGVTGYGAGYVAFRNTAGTNTLDNTLELIGGAGDSELTSDAGLLQVNGPVFLGNLSSRRLVLSGTAGAGLLNGTLGNQPTNALSLSKSGSGTWTLTAANAYTGSTTVSGGTLLVNGSIGGSTVTVQTNGTLGGTGSVGAPVTVNPGGILSPGTSVGTLTLGSTLTNRGTVFMEIGRTGATLANDRLVTTAGIDYGGTLVVSNAGSSPLQAGDTFQLFVAGGYTGGFTNLVLPAGYVWTNSLAIDGRIGVESVTSVNPPKVYLTNSFSGSAITFNWSGTAYRLMAQTNPLGVGLGTNWFPYPGGSVSPVVVPVNPANGATFYMLSTNAP